MVRLLKSRYLIVTLILVAFFGIFQSVSLAQDLSPRVMVNTFRLNVRTGPGVGHDILTTVAGGTELPVTMIATDGKWFQVDVDGVSGWLHSFYTLARGSFTSVPRQGVQAPSGSGATDLAEGEAHLVVNTAWLNVRSGPGLGHDVITVVPGGTNLRVLSIASDGVWYEVDTSAGAGWVHSGLTVGRGNFAGIPRSGGTTTTTVAPPDVSGYAPHLVVNTPFLNVRTGAGVSHAVLTTVRGGTILPVTRIASGNVWYEVTSTAGTGWVNRTYTVTRGNFAGIPRDA